MQILWVRHDYSTRLLWKLYGFGWMKITVQNCRQKSALHKAVTDVKRTRRVPKVTFNIIRFAHDHPFVTPVFLHRPYTSLFVFSIFSFLVLSLKVYGRRYARCQIKSMKIRGSRDCVRQKQWKQIRAMENYRVQKNEKAVIASYKGPRGKVP